MNKRVRIAAIQFDHRPVASFEEFAKQVKTYVTYAHDDRAELVVFPEYLTGALLGINPDSSVWTEPYKALFTELAGSTGMMILAGTHLTERDGATYNTAHLFMPDGQILTQDKVHMTPCEVDPWCLAKGEGVKVFDTPIGKLAILVCFDSEFPELALVACEAGADLLLVPSATADRQGFWRVRHCCQARAVENQVYVVHSALVGGLPDVRYMEQNYGTSAIITPCDIPFPPKGIAAEGEWNQGLCVIGEIDLGLLNEVRKAGSVLPRTQRRPEAYKVL